MKTFFTFAVILILASLSATAQTVRLQQRNSAGAWVTLQSQIGKSGSFNNVPAGPIRICVEQDNTVNCIDSENGKALTMPQSPTKTVTTTFHIANGDWILKLVLSGPTVGWNWGKSSATGTNNAR